MKLKERSDVQCPFYQQDNGRNLLTCEGVTDGSRLQWQFRRKKDFAVQMEVFCCEHYTKCEVYRMAADKYE